MNNYANELLLVLVGRRWIKMKLKTKIKDVHWKNCDTNYISTMEARVQD